MSSNVPSYPPREQYRNAPPTREPFVPTAPPYHQHPLDFSDNDRFQDPSKHPTFYPPPQQHGRLPQGGNVNTVSTKPPSNPESHNFHHYEMGPMKNQYPVRSMSPADFGYSSGMMVGSGIPPVNHHYPPFSVGGMQPVPPPYLNRPHFQGGGGFTPHNPLSPSNEGISSSNMKVKLNPSKQDKGTPKTKKDVNEKAILSELKKESQQRVSTQTLINEVGPILGGDANQVKDDFEAKFINNIATVLGKHKRGRPSLREKAKSKEERDLELAKKIRVEVYGGDDNIAEETSKRPKIDDSHHTEGNELDHTNGTMTQAYENESVESEDTKPEDGINKPDATNTAGPMSNMYFAPTYNVNEPNNDYNSGRPYRTQESTMQSTLDKLAANRKKAALSARKKRAEHKEFVMKLTEQVILLRKQNNELELKIKELESENEKLRGIEGNKVERKELSAVKRINEIQEKIEKETENEEKEVKDEKEEMTNHHIPDESKYDPIEENQ